MPPEAKTDKSKEKETKEGIPSCTAKGPGPKYQLKTLVGYEEHCISRFRNPAYSFGHRQTGEAVCPGPGPKYLVTEPKRGGFTFGYAAKSFDTTCGPGPKYNLPDVRRGPAFSMKWRTDHRKTGCTPAPYSVRSKIGGPAFTIGLRAKGLKCDMGPGPQAPCNLDAVKPRPPSFSIGFRQTREITCEGPGPKYYPKIPRQPPIYSFGLKHSECAPPYIVESDDQC